MISHFSQPCIFLVEKGGKASCTAVFTTLYRQVRKKCATNKNLHRTPAIITRLLDHCQGLFLLPGSGARGSMRRPYSRQSARGCSIGQEWGRGFYPSVSGSRAFPGVFCRQGMGSTGPGGCGRPGGHCGGCPFHAQRGAGALRFLDHRQPHRRG